jgi:hypothetical protein
VLTAIAPRSLRRHCWLLLHCALHTRCARLLHRELLVNAMARWEHLCVCILHIAEAIKWVVRVFWHRDG